jgi:hypothetical protein
MELVLNLTADPVEVVKTSLNVHGQFRTIHSTNQSAFIATADHGWRAAPGEGRETGGRDPRAPALGASAGGGLPSALTWS